MPSAESAESDEIRRDPLDRGPGAEVRPAAEALPAADTLVDVAEGTGAESVVGLRRRSRTGEFPLGGNARTVLPRSPRDVLAIRVSADD